MSLMSLERAQTDNKYRNEIVFRRLIYVRILPDNIAYLVYLARHTTSALQGYQVHIVYLTFVEIH